MASDGSSYITAQTLNVNEGDYTFEATLLFVGAGIETKPAIEIAKNMGIHTVASDMSLSAPGILVSDDYFIASTYDIDKTVLEAELYNKNKRKISGVICVATDVPKTVASVANKLGLPGISMNSAILASNKLLMKKKISGEKSPSSLVFRSIFLRTSKRNLKN